MAQGDGHATGLHEPAKKCPHCGSSYLYDGTLQGAQARISEPEDELKQLRASPSSQLQAHPYPQPPQHPATALANARASRASVDGSLGVPEQTSRPSSPGYFASFRMMGLKSTSASTPGIGHSHSSGYDTAAGDLQSALARETALRVEAERTAAQAHGELEELSATLFEEANEMVATERRARAKLEERLAVLEQRDGEKKRRLEKLDAALGRLERVKTLLGT